MSNQFLRCFYGCLRLTIKRGLSVAIILIGIGVIPIQAGTGYTLVYKEGGEEHRVIGVEDSKLFYMVNGEREYATLAGEFSLKTDEDVDPALMYYPLNYCITLADSMKLRKGTPYPYDTYISITDMKSGWKAMDVNELKRAWLMEDLDNSILLYVWISGHKMEVADITLFNYVDKDANLNRRFSKPLTNAELSGYPGIILYKDGKTIPPQQLAADEDLQRCFLYAKRGETEKLDGVLKAGAQVNKKDVLGNTMLHYASSSGHLETVRLLIGRGADINGKNNEGNTPLMLASANARLSVVNELLAHNAKVKLRNRRGDAATHLAAYFGHDAVFGALLDSGADVNLLSGDYHTPVTIALNNKRNAVVKRLSEANVNLIERKNIMYEQLLSAASTGETEIVRFLLSLYGRDQYFLVLNDDYRFHYSIDDQDRSNLHLDPDFEQQGVTPLFAAAKQSEPELLELLIEAGADVNWANERGVTPLISAAYHGNCEGVSYLAQAGADINHQSEAGITALFAATTGLHFACVQSLIESGADPNIAAADGVTPVEIATIVGSEEIVTALINAGSVCKLDTVERAMPLMEYAFMHDIPQVVKIALEQCLTADFRFFEKYPAVWVAQYYDNRKILELLTEKGASPAETFNPEIAAIDDVADQIKVTKLVNPEYPSDLQARFGEQRVMVEVIIGEDGNVLFPKVVEGELPMVNRTVIEAVRQWKFKPVTVDGAPTLARVRIPLVLRVNNPEDIVFRIEELDVQPKAVKKIPPFYPDELILSNTQGHVTLEFVIDKDGSILDIAVIKTTGPLFSEAALEAAWKWKFTPAYLDGKTVKAKIKLPIEYWAESLEFK